MSATGPQRYPKMDDQLSKLLVEGIGTLMNDFPDEDYPTFTDEHYRARLLELSGEIQYRLTDDIKNHIIHRTERYRTATERTLGLSEMYFPIFEEHLAEKNIPHHIKYLSIVESNLNPVAKSRASAVGLWQFMPETGRIYGLRVASHLDERSDTHKASHAAATMLSFLYKRYGDWGLALSAYNCGPGRVDKYVKGNDKSYWDIRASLPKETQMYVPYFMAVAYSYEFHHLHELVATPQPSDLVLTDSIHLGNDYHSMAELSTYYGIDRDTLKRLNPAYLKGYAPSGEDNILVLPARIVAKFRGYEAAYNKIMSIRTENPIKCIRRINSEADLELLMRAHRFSRHDLLFWNALPANYRVQPGDVVAVRKYYVPKDAWQKKEERKNVESISIASLKVVGMDNKQQKALTAPVYVAAKTPKLSDNISTAALLPQTMTSKNNAYELKNTATALPAQKAQKEEIIAEVSENRDRGRRLRTTDGVVKKDIPMVNTVATTTNNNSIATNTSPTTYKKPEMLAVKSVSAEDAAAAAEKAKRDAAVQLELSIAQREAAETARLQAAEEEKKHQAATKAAEESQKMEAAQEVSELSRSIQSKEQAVSKAKVYEKTSSEEMSALSALAEQTEKLKKEREAANPVTTTTAQPALEDTYEYHTVKMNETIWDVSKQYTGISASEIMALNNIDANTVLRAGAILKIRVKK